MNIRHPLEFVPPNYRLRLFFVFTLLCITAYIIFMVLDQPMRTAAAPTGIVSFELAGSVVRAQAMLDSWDGNARINTAFGLGFDFLFMPIYALALGLGVLMAQGRRVGIWQAAGKALGWGILAAIGFDAIENTALLTILKGNNIFPYPQLAAGCASLKFILLICGSVYGLVGWLFPEKSIGTM